MIAFPHCRNIPQNEDRIYKRRATFTILFPTNKFGKGNVFLVRQVLTNKYIP